MALMVDGVGKASAKVARDSDRRRADALSCKADRSAAMHGLAATALRRLAGTKSLPRAAADAYAEDCLDRFIAKILESDVDGAVRIARGLVRDGASFSQMADTLIAGAARQLGLRWEDDSLSFFQVSIGITTLQRVSHALRREERPLGTTDIPRALFVSLPNQAHVLGLILAAEAFRQTDWEVDLQFEADAGDIVAAVGRAEPELVGFTAGRVGSLQAIAAVVGHLKALRRPPCVVIGGLASNQCRDVAAVSGADIIVSGIEDALECAASLRTSSRPTK